MTTGKLLSELVPSPTWGWNLRSVLTEDGWDEIRKAAYRSANYLCEVCGGKGPNHPVECHERWAYDDSRKIQKLLGVEALCPSCHEVRHLGRAIQTGRGPAAKQHMMKVNGWTLTQVEAHIRNAMKVWEARSRFQWELDLSWLQELPSPRLRR